MITSTTSNKIYLYVQQQKKNMVQLNVLVQNYFIIFVQDVHETLHKADNNSKHRETVNLS